MDLNTQVRKVNKRGETHEGDHGRQEENEWASGKQDETKEVEIKQEKTTNTERTAEVHHGSPNKFGF